jgi:hypothetical protein
MMPSPTGPVRRRKVFYIPGFDPVHPRRYRELYRKEGAAQAAISGYDLALAPDRTDAAYGWTVRARIDGFDVDTKVEVLVWSDIVRDVMAPGLLASYGQLAHTVWIYVATGTLWRLMRMRKGPVIAALYPVLAMLLYLAAAVGLGACLALWLMALMPPGLAATLIAVLAGGLLGLAVLRWCRARDHRLYTFYLLHNYAYSASRGGAMPDRLRACVAGFTARIAQALDSDVDEVLVVGHSSGAHLAVSAIAPLPQAHGPALGLLTLGHVMPMVSFLPRAEDLRADLQSVSERTDLAWVDVTAPGDGCAFALCDPVAVSGVARPAQCGPLVLSAAFSRTLSPSRWAALRWRFFRLHFQYLCAFDRPGAYDYFRITAGALTLGARFAGQAPSRARITTALSRYRSVRAA